VKRSIAQVSTSIATTALLTGCIFQPEPKIVQGEPYPASGTKTQQERRDVGSLKVETSPSASALDVTITQPVECRDGTPMVRDVTTVRETNGMEQLINGGSAVLLGGIGAAVMLSPCTTTPSGTSSNPNPPSQPCTSDEKDTRTVTGGVLIGTGALFGAAFLYNIIRARDSRETVPAQMEASWKACATKPLANVAATLKFADGKTCSGTTDNAGRVSFQVASVRWTDDALRPGSAEINVGDKTTSVSLASLPAYVAWKEKEQAVAQQVEQQCTAHCEQEALACMRFTRDTFGAVNQECNWASTKKTCMDGCRPKLMAAAQAQPAQPTSAPSVDIEATLNAFDADVTTADQFITLLERTKAPWPEAVITRVKPIGETLGRLASASTVLGSTAIPKSLEPRALASAGKATQVVARGNALEPSVKKTVAFYQARRNAQTAALLQAMFSGGGGSVAPSSPPPQQERAEDERRHQQERADDGRKRQDDATARRNNCVSQCQNEASSCFARSSRDYDACLQTCGHMATPDCRRKCEDDGNARQHSCHERHDEGPCRSRCN
jgi:hypothetical protein